MNTSSAPVYNYTDHSFPPDSEALKIACIVVFALYTAYSILLAIFIFLRRNKQPVKVRAPPLLITHIFVLWVVMAIFTLRIITGRADFPCFIYMTTYYVFAPEVAVPEVLRCYRFILVFKLSRYSATITDRARSTKLLKAMKLLVSYKFVAGMFIGILLLHTILGFIFTGIFTSVGPENLYTTSGCNSGNNVYFTAVMLIIYGMLIIIMFFIIVKEWREPYLIRVEMVINAVVVILCVVPFLVANFDYDYWVCCEYTWFPGGAFLLVGSILETTFSCTIPCLLSFRKKYNTNVESNATNVEKIDTILNNEKHRAVFKEYLIRSLCPEALLFWEDVQAYNMLKSDSERELSIREMYDKYLSDTAIVELNLPGKNTLLAPILQAVNDFRDNGTSIPTNVLDTIVSNCRNDLLDPLSRFVNTSLYKQIETSIQSEKKQVEMMQQLGMVQSVEMHELPISNEEL